MSDDDRETDAPADPGAVDLPAPVRSETQRLLRHGLRLVRELIEEGRADYANLCRRAERLGNEKPEAYRAPVAWWASWVDLASKKLTDTECPVWIGNADLVALGEDLAGPALAAMRSLREHRDRLCIPPYEGGQPVEIDLRWTLKGFARKSPGEADEPRCGRAKAVPESERLTWRGPGDAPYFRLELSLPWFLLADEDEKEHGLHDLLCYARLVGRETDPKPKIGKPDIVAWAPTLGRFGARFVREVAAVVHAQAHPAHRQLSQAHGYDPVTGQGLIWGDLEAYRREEARKGEEGRPRPSRTEAPRQGKDAAAEPRELELYATDDEGPN